MSWVDDNLLVPGEAVLHRTNARGGWEHVVTSHRLIAVKRKLIGRDVFEINLTNVESVTVQRDLFGRLSNQGTIIIGSGSGNRDLELPNVPDPMEFRRQALAAVDART